MASIIGNFMSLSRPFLGLWPANGKYCLELLLIVGFFEGGTHGASSLGAGGREQFQAVQEGKRRPLLFP